MSCRMRVRVFDDGLGFRYEYLYNTTGLEKIETAHTPMTVRTPRGTYLSIHEAALVAKVASHVTYGGTVSTWRSDSLN